MNHSPFFCHLYASPLVYQNPKDDNIEAIDELDYHQEQKLIRKIACSQNVQSNFRFLTTHCTAQNFLKLLPQCQVLHFTGINQCLNF